MDVTVVRERLRAMREAREGRPLVFAFAGEPYDPALRTFASGVRAVLERHGHRFRAEGDGELHLVFNFVNPARPRAYRRRAKATFVVAVVLEAQPPEDVLRSGYPLLVRSLANLCVYLVRHPDGVRTHFVTLEQGAYAVAGEFSSPEYFEGVYERLQPLACSQLVIDNVFEPDLPPELWEGDERTRELSEAGRRLDALGLLPAPFPIDQLLSPRDLRHIELLYGIGGLSYGNLSVRKDATRFWMSASGVNKAHMRVVGRDMLLVKGFDP
ncbi:MAG: ribulose phosphate epimerase, partial [candidate division GAL15 bacterium]